VGHLNQRLESTLISDGPDAVSYQLSQVGNDKKGEFLPLCTARTDQKAQQFLSSLDDDPAIGRLIDQTMDFEYEQAQMLQKSGEDLTPEMWIMK